MQRFTSSVSFLDKVELTTNSRKPLIHLILIGSPVVSLQWRVQLADTVSRSSKSLNAVPGWCAA